ncbi:PTS sugar transporter subunit IIA [Sandaracinobacter neustonicus]|uniref:PTS sugar transporter subunit IIA n=1 Tax=Sandaracinobacter neustonicus TaxID=1715348 RepID=A0A501XRJ0_9SPHN|nr:PTS sugar transporter subunit IIA [Sandaracinobacter neustonicus]TPE63291.1 PTS sugar transporter subunit IIA [Sandaracinobacter neustonicus]
MEFRDLLAPSAVALDVHATTPKAVFDRAAAMLATATGITEEAISAALAERERLGTTGFGGGSAIPHGRVAGLRGMAAAVVRTAHPLDWHALDGLPVDLVVVLIGPEEAGADHLKSLALVSRTLRDKQLVAKMRGAVEPGALWTLLAGPQRRAA